MCERNGRQARILIVDPDPVARVLMTEMLQPEGYHITVLSSGVGLLNALPQLQPDVLLLDAMPHANGLEICRAIKANTDWEYLPIILVTASAADDYLVTALDAGADDFVPKPLSAAQLRARVRSMCRLKRRAGDLHRVSQMREDLANMVVHDMRAPLTVCMMRADMLLHAVDRHRELANWGEGRRTPFLKSSLQTIKGQLEELNALVDDILLLARTEHESLVLNLELVDLSSLIQRVSADHDVLARRNEVRLQVEAPRQPFFQRLDYNLVRRMAGNLVGNAVKFSPPGGRVIVRLLSGEAGSSSVIEVTDQGPGIPAGERKRIFDRYAVAAANNVNVRGIGLGLAFSKMVVEAHGGTISVYDNVPSGTVFRVRL